MKSNDTSVLQAAISVLNFAESLPIEQLAERNTKPAYPVTIGERLVSYTLQLLLTHEWGDDEAEALADEMESVLSQLDTGVDKPDEWRALFEIARRAAERLNA